MAKKQKRRVPRPAAKLFKPTPKRLRANASVSPTRSKVDAIVTALRAREGATLAQLMTLTGWQAHSVRGAISGTLKKARGLTVTSTRVNDERVYRIEAGR